jgi:hypothetical protein
VLARIDAAAADRQLRDAEAAFAAAEVEQAAFSARPTTAAAGEKAERLTAAQMIARADLDATETSSMKPAPTPAPQNPRS